MRASKIILGLFILIIFFTASTTFAQKQFIQTVTTQNTACNYGCSLMDVPGTISSPELNENPAAIILATQVGNLNPHTVAAYYRAYEKKWSLFNVDGFNIVPNAKYNVEYWANPGPNQFVYIAPYGASPCIDHVGLNDTPNAQVRIFPTANPALGGLFNRNEVKIEYDATARKWCVGNKLPNLVFPGGTAYNIVISSPTPLPAMNTATFVPLPTPTPTTPTTSTPNGNAGGDLNGNYPNPTVVGLQNKPISSVAPTTKGQVLKWNGTAWEPATDDVGTATTSPFAPIIQTVFKTSDSAGVWVLPHTQIYADLQHSITLTKKSRLIISAIITFESPSCNFDCKGFEGYFGVELENWGELGYTKLVGVDFFGLPNKRASAIISNFMVDLDPGTHTVKFYIQNDVGGNNIGAIQFRAIFQRQSSVMVIPLE